MSTDLLRSAAHTVLAAVGDAALGEWEERSGTAFHLRRRLTAAESDYVGEVRDIRGTDEAVRRVNTVRRSLRAAWNLDKGDSL